MKKSILLALLAITGTVLCTESAYAGCRRGCGRTNNCGTRSTCNSCNSCNASSSCSTCTAGCMMAPNQQPAPMTVAQSNGSSTYQSNSFEPGNATAVTSTAVPIYVAPAYRQANWSEYNSVLSGNRKVLGHRATGE